MKSLKKCLVIIGERDRETNFQEFMILNIGVKEPRRSVLNKITLMRQPFVFYRMI